MKEKDALKILKSLGVQIAHKDKHYYLTYKEKWTTMLRHPSKEFKNENLKNILRQLGIKHRF